MLMYLIKMGMFLYECEIKLNSVVKWIVWKWSCTWCVNLSVWFRTIL